MGGAVRLETAVDEALEDFRPWFSMDKVGTLIQLY